MGTAIYQIQKRGVWVGWVGEYVIISFCLSNAFRNSFFMTEDKPTDFLFLAIVDITLKYSKRDYSRNTSNC